MKNSSSQTADWRDAADACEDQLATARAERDRYRRALERIRDYEVPAAAGALRRIARLALGEEAE